MPELCFNKVGPTCSAPKDILEGFLWVYVVHNKEITRWLHYYTVSIPAAASIACTESNGGSRPRRKWKSNVTKGFKKTSVCLAGTLGGPFSSEAQQRMSVGSFFQNGLG